MFCSDFGDTVTCVNSERIKKEISYNYGTNNLRNSSVCPPMHYQVKEMYRPSDEFLVHISHMYLFRVQEVRLDKLVE